MPKRKVSTDEVIKCRNVRARLDILDAYNRIIKSLIPRRYSQEVQAELTNQGKRDKYTDTQIRKIRNGEIYDLEVWQILEKISVKPTSLTAKPQPD